MKYAVILLLVPAIGLAQDFRFSQELDSIPVHIGDWQPWQPWAGGLMECNPALVDIDGDSDLDFMIGEVGGWLKYFKNEGGSSAASFSLAAVQFDSIHVAESRSNPCFRDIDADGDLDLIIGDIDSYVYLYLNMGTPENPDFVLQTNSLVPQGPPWCVAPELVDIDDDGDYDLFGGFQQITFYLNEGTPQSFNFVLASANFAGANVAGYASPEFIDIDADGDYDLFIGERYGHIWYYRNDGDSVNYNFTYVTDFYDGIDVGDYASPEFADIDGDGDYDLFVGREPDWATAGPGDVFFYENIGTSQVPQFQLVTTNYLSLDEGHLAMLDLIDIDADGDQDLFITALDSLRFYRNVGSSQSPSFVREIAGYQGIYANDLSPFFCDIDADSDYDLFCGSGAIPGPPGLYLYLNQGTARNPDFVLYSNNFVPGNYEVFIYPTLADIDADGDLDLFLCDHDTLYFFANQGTPQWPNFQREPGSWQGIYPGSLGIHIVFGILMMMAILIYFSAIITI